MEKLLKGLQSHRAHSTYSTALPRLKAKKYLEPDEIARPRHVQWGSLNHVKKMYVEPSIDSSIEISPTNVSHPQFFEYTESNSEMKMPIKVKKRKKIRKIDRKKLDKLNRPGMLMKSHVTNNENYVRDSPPSTDSSRVLYISPVMRNFFHSNISTSRVNGQSELKLHDVDAEKNSRVPSNWKIPIARTLISGDEDLRYLEEELHSLRITKLPETTVTEIKYSPRIVIDRYKIRSDAKMVKRKLLNYVNINNVKSLNVARRKKNEKKHQRDFAISLTGKIHIDGEAGGPMSITFDTSPSGENPVKINRRSANDDIRKSSNKIPRSEPSEVSEFRKNEDSESRQNLISNELPEMDPSSEMVTTMPDRILPYFADEPAIVHRPLQTPVNLKIIGLISMSNPRPDMELSPEKANKDWLGDFKIVPLRVSEKQTVTQPQETNARTTSKSCPFGTRTTVQEQFFTTPVTTKSDIPETVTFYVDSDDGDSSDVKSQKCPFGDNSLPGAIKVDEDRYPLVGGDEERMNDSGGVETVNDGVGDGGMTEGKNDLDEQSGRDGDSRLSSMLAIMEFIRKIKGVLGGESCSNEDPGAVIRLQKFVITPENTSDSEHR